MGLALTRSQDVGADENITMDLRYKSIAKLGGYYTNNAVQGPKVHAFSR
jgi:hypothetical protein